VVDVSVVVDRTGGDFSGVGGWEVDEVYRSPVGEGFVDGLEGGDS
jgi:hypothetical protein